jgi:formamidopyrimidine-DNA glycosylase
MPEIAEGLFLLPVNEDFCSYDPVARIVHYLRKSLVGKTIKTVTAQDDGNVFGKVGTSGPEFQKALIGKKVVGAGQQGKYFWFEILDALRCLY